MSIELSEEKLKRQELKKAMKLHFQYGKDASAEKSTVSVQRKQI